LAAFERPWQVLCHHFCHQYYYYYYYYYYYRNITMLTFQHYVDDVEHTLQELYREEKDETAMAPAKAVVGHSFRERMALEYVAAASASGEPLEALWLLDTVPRQVHEIVDQVLATVTDIVGKNSSIEQNELVQVLTETYGMEKGVAQWLGSSYNAKTGDFGFSI
jgi:hypothetical protein